MANGLQDKLQKYQNRAARVISGAGYETRSTDVLESLGWETLEKRRLRNKAVLMYKILNDHSAPNLKQLFNKRNEAQTSYNLRNNQTDITLPNPKTEYLKRTLGYNGAKLWNSLPYHLKVAASICASPKYEHRELHLNMPSYLHFCVVFNYFIGGGGG